MEEILQTKFKEVIAELGNQFTSHDFIKKFLAMHENDYRQWFNNTTLVSVHIKIGRLLTDNQENLSIEKDGRVCSETFHGTMSEVQRWKKTNNI